MSDSSGIPELQYTHPDGRPRSRLEMEQWLRRDWNAGSGGPKVHWLRVIAARTFGLPKNISWDMREIVLKHWLLDEMVRKNLIVGDLLGINSTASNDEGELRQFVQRLAAMIQAGNAVQPEHAEGVDMNGYTPPPPPVMGGAPPNGQQQAYPPGPPAPPPPMGAPVGPPGYSVPPPPPGPVQYAQQPQQQQPMGPPGGYQQPPAPVGPPGPPAPPPAGAPQGGRGRGRKAAGDGQAQQPPQAAPVPQMGPPPVPPGFAPAGYTPQVPQMPQMPQQPGFPLPGQAPAVAAPPQQFQQPHATAAAVDLGPVYQKLDQLIGIVTAQAAEIAAFKRQLLLISMVSTLTSRAMYQRQGSTEAEGWLKELSIPLPQ